MKAIAKQQRCVILRNKLEIWIDAEQADNLTKVINNKDIWNVDIEGQIVNKSSIEGIFTPDKVAEIHRRGVGDYKCKAGEWHTRNDLCQHPSPEQVAIHEAKKKELKEMYER